MQNITYEGAVYKVPQHPQRIATLANSLLYMVYALDGKSVARPSSVEALPPELQKVPTIGHTAHINTEKLLQVKPDFVLGLQKQHGKLAEFLDSNKIPHMLINYDGIHDNVPLLEALGKILNKEDKAKEVISLYNKKIAKVKEAIKDEKSPRTAILFATGSAVTAETTNAIAASMAQDLGINNVILGHLDKDTKAKSIPYSLETLSLDNPDVIFIVSMGNKAAIAKQMETSMTSNPAWNQLRAVKNHRVYYLPSQLFLLNPGIKTPEAMAQLVELAYGHHVDLKDVK